MTQSSVKGGWPTLNWVFIELHPFLSRLHHVHTHDGPSGAYHRWRRALR